MSEQHEPKFLLHTNGSWFQVVCVAFHQLEQVVQLVVLVSIVFLVGFAGFHILIHSLVVEVLLVGVHAAYFFVAQLDLLVIFDLSDFLMGNQVREANDPKPLVFTGFMKTA